MERSVIDITLDLTRSYSPETVTVKRGDTYRSLRIRLADGGRPYPIESNCTAVFTAVKPDGSHLYNACRVEDAILYDLTPQTTAIPGQLECELRLYGENGALLTSAAFVLTVADTVYADGDENIASTGEATALTKLLVKTEEKLDQVEDALQSIAPLQKTYELIEDVTLTEDVESFTRTADTNGVAYNFRAMRIYVETPAAAGANNNSQIIFCLGTKSSDFAIYVQVSGGVTNTARTTLFQAQNANGLRDIWFATAESGGSTTNKQTRTGHGIVAWQNVVKLTLSAYPSALVIPAGTRIRIYGIRE